MATNPQVMKAFAEGEEENAEHLFSEKLSAKNVWVIYSYGRHFPMAMRLSDGSVVLNTDKYSRTTSKQQTQLLSYISGRCDSAINTKGMKALISHIEYQTTDAKFDKNDLRLFQL